MLKALLAIGWKSHLMGTEGCKQNSRRRAVQQSTLSHAQGMSVSTATAKTTMVISESKARGLGRGSRIPAPASRINRRTRICPGKASSHRLQQHRLHASSFAEIISYE